MKKCVLLCLTLVAAGSLTLASGKVFIGKVGDSKCGAKMSTAACVAKCVSGGEKYVLVSHGKVYTLDAQDKFADFAGKTVKVTGTVSGNDITVESVAAYGAKPKKAAKTSM